MKPTPNKAMDTKTKSEDVTESSTPKLLRLKMDGKSNSSIALNVSKVNWRGGGCDGKTAPIRYGSKRIRLSPIT